MTERPLRIAFASWPCPLGERIRATSAGECPRRKEEELSSLQKSRLMMTDETVHGISQTDSGGGCLW